MNFPPKYWASGKMKIVFVSDDFHMCLFLASPFLRLLVT